MQDGVGQVAVDPSCDQVWPEKIDAHRRMRRDVKSGEPEPYEVRLVDRRHAENPACPRRWCPAASLAPEQLCEYRHGLLDKMGVEGAPNVWASASSKKDLAASKCQTHEETTLLRTKNARCTGWLFACTPNGYIVHLKEFIGAESLAQRYFFLSEIQHIAKELKLVIHDDACHLRRYADKRKTSSPAAAALAFPAISYVIDRFYFKGHVDPWCKQECNPDSEGNAKLMQGVNTSRCEELFSKIGRRKFAVREMNRHTAMVFLNEIAALRNDRWLTDFRP